MADEQDDIRADINAALSELSSGDKTTETSPAAEPSGEATRTDGRDASGRFAPRVPAEESVPADTKPEAVAPEGTAAPAPGTAPTHSAQQAVRAPASWSPEEREGWDKLSPTHQKAVLRREQQINTVLQNTANERGFAKSMFEAIQPHMDLLQAENVTPQQAVHNLMNTAKVLRNGDPATKARAVADMIMRYNIPLEMLDGHLTQMVQQGRRPDPQIDMIMRAVDSRLAPIVNSMRQSQQQGQQQSVAVVTAELDAFVNDPANEFANDVLGDMADLLELAAARGQVLSLQDAYKRATMAHPTISDVLHQRSLRSAAQRTSAAAERAQNASASLSTTSAPAANETTNETDGSMRADILASVAELSRRQRMN